MALTDNPPTNRMTADDGDPLDPDQVRESFDDLVTLLTAGLRNRHIASDADIAGSKLADDSVANAKLSGSIALSKLANAVPRVKVVSYTGAAANNSVTGVGFKPDVIVIYRTDTHSTTTTFRAEATADVGNLHVSDAHSILGDAEDAIRFDSDGFTFLKNSDYWSSASAYTYYAKCEYHSVPV